jgi:ketosteroid isomerase-like protein
VTHSMTPREVFLELVHGGCERRVTDLPRLYATATNVAHPFDPLRTQPLRTRDELREHFTGRADSGASFRLRPTNITIDDTSDPEVIVAEFTYLADVTETGDKFAIPCIFVLRVRDGEIVESRDYIDQQRSAQVRGQLDTLVDAVKRRSGQQ